MPIHYKDNLVQELLSAAQTLTGAWADLGDVIDTRDIKKVAVWLDLDVNDSQNVRVRFVGKKTNASTEVFVLPIKTIGVSDVKVEDEYFELNEDVDQKVMIDSQVGDLTPFIQIQVMAGVPGASPGQLLTAGVSFSSAR